MRYQTLFLPKNNNKKKMFKNVVYCSCDWNFKAKMQCLTFGENRHPYCKQQIHKSTNISAQSDQGLSRQMIPYLWYLVWQLYKNHNMHSILAAAVKSNKCCPRKHWSRVVKIYVATKKTTIINISNIYTAKLFVFYRLETKYEATKQCKHSSKSSLLLAHQLYSKIPYSN